jgi:hypothetical protein
MIAVVPLLSEDRLSKKITEVEEKVLDLEVVTTTLHCQLIEVTEALEMIFHDNRKGWELQERMIHEQQDRSAIFRKGWLVKKKNLVSGVYLSA